MFNEILKLAGMLISADIPFDFKRTDWIEGEGYQIIVYHDAAKTLQFDDCIFHKYSYGYEKGLLETSVLGECNGYETAEQVFKGWNKIHRDYLKKNPPLPWEE